MSIRLRVRILEHLGRLLLEINAMVGTAAPQAVVSPFESPEALTPRSKIDELVFARLKQLGIQPANLCSDAVFVRRAYLDVIGTLPTAQEARTFLMDQDPNKRSTLIDRLLDRGEFADYWAMKWSELPHPGCTAGKDVSHAKSACAQNSSSSTDSDV
jgi:hypothetical protein